MGVSLNQLRAAISLRFIFDAAAGLFRKIAHFEVGYRRRRAPATNAIFRRDGWFCG